MKKILNILTTFLLFTVLLSGCQSAYYGAMEKVGYHKRDIMVDRVEDAKESQQEAKEQFSSALEELTRLINFDGGDLDAVYNKTKDEYESAQEAAIEVSKRIGKVEDVAEALFDEWQTEIDEISKANLRRSSENKFKETRRSYTALLKSMRRAESKMLPVLTALKDNTLFLKHNLNAQAIGSIKGEFSALQADITGLISDMNRSIDSSTKFIESLQSTQ